MFSLVASTMPGHLLRCLCQTPNHSLELPELDPLKKKEPRHVSMYVNMKEFLQNQETPTPEPIPPLPPIEKLSPEEFNRFLQGESAVATIEAIILPTLISICDEFFYKDCPPLPQLEEDVENPFDLQPLEFFKIYHTLYQTHIGNLPRPEAGWNLEDYFDLNSPGFEEIYKEMVRILRGEYSKTVPGDEDDFKLWLYSLPNSLSEVNDKVDRALEFLRNSDFPCFTNAAAGLEALLLGSLPPDLNPDLFVLQKDFQIKPVVFRFEEKIFPYFLATHYEGKIDDSSQKFLFTLGPIDVSPLGNCLSDEAFGLALAKEFYTYSVLEFVANNFLDQ